MADDRETGHAGETASRVVGYALVLAPLVLLGMLRSKRASGQLGRERHTMTSTMPQSEDLVPRAEAAWRVWFALLGAPIAWFVHFFAIWAVSEAACPTGLADVTLLGLNMPTVLTLLAALVALVVVVASGVVGYRIRRAAQADESGGPEAERSAYVGLVGALLSVLLTLTVVLETAPFLTFAPCV